MLYNHSIYYIFSIYTFQVLFSVQLQIMYTSHHEASIGMQTMMWLWTTVQEWGFDKSTNKYMWSVKTRAN